MRGFLGGCLAYNDAKGTWESHEAYRQVASIILGGHQDRRVGRSHVLTPELRLELQHYLSTLPDDLNGWLFPSTRKGVPTRPGNFLNRVLKPAAMRAGISVRELGMNRQTSALNFQSLRRTSSTVFGARAKDPKSTQAHMRHTDSYVTLKHYQREIPAEVKAAALAYERDLLDVKRKREEAPEASDENLPIV